MDMYNRKSLYPWLIFLLPLFLSEVEGLRMCQRRFYRMSLQDRMFCRHFRRTFWERRRASQPECGRGKWGVSCKQTCDSHCLGSTCDKVSGQCNRGCEPGYSPPNCSQVCSRGYHGERCTKKCPDGCADGSCYHVTGACFSCRPGYRGILCDQECDHSHWGLNCSSSCSEQCVFKMCDHVTGHCYLGCERGYQPPNCTKACPYGHYGNKCSQSCPPGCSEEGCQAKYGDCYTCISGYQGQHCDKSTVDCTLSS